MREAIDRDTASKFLPTIIFDQLGQNFLEGDSVQRIVLLIVIHFVHESESFDYWEYNHPLYQGRGQPTVNYMLCGHLSKRYWQRDLDFANQKNQSIAANLQVGTLGGYTPL